MNSPRGLLGTVADLLAFVGAIGSASVLIFQRSVPQAILAAVVSGLAVAFLVISFRLHRQVVQAEQRYERHVSTAKALPKLPEAMAHLSRATLTAEHKEMFTLHGRNACQSLVEMFDLATGSPCRVTVKRVYSPDVARRPDQARGESAGQGVAVRTIWRSHEDHSSSREDGASIDWVEDNTDFWRLFTSGAPFYLCNDLPREVGRGYVNSHWPREKIAKMLDEDDFPYRSTVVWPIMGPAPDSSNDIAGFLCVDSTEVDAFDQDFDVATGGAFAHALYSGLVRYREAHGAPSA